MNVLMHIIFYIFVSSLCWYLWKKYHTRDYVKLAFIGICAALADTAEYLLKSIFEMHPLLRTTFDVAFIVLWLVFIFFTLRVLFAKGR
jgi:hypothetical protein